MQDHAPCAIKLIILSHTLNCGQVIKSHSRDDYNSLTSDIFQTILLNVRPLIHYLSNAMYGCPIKLGTNVAINGFCLIISENL